MMQNLIDGFGAQLVEALDIASKATLSKPSQPVQNIVIAGMGGSGIGGNLVTALTANDISCPITLSKSYDIPAFVGPNTLFIACSFSGNTEETIDATNKALKTGAKIVCITSGGKLGELAAANNLDTIHIPGRSGSPRASIGYSFVQLLHIFHAFGLTKSAYTSELEATIKLLDAENDNIKEAAKALAGQMKDKLVFFYGDSKLEAVLIRTQQQIAENSKHISHVNVFPEMNHNELVGWKYPEGIYANAIVVLARTSFEHPRNTIRIEVCKGIFKEHVKETVELVAKGTSFTEQSIYLIHLLDWASFYLAELNNVDPFPVDVINYLKDELAKHA
jgi:glucose/mannose-6-phosphate isomerase